MLCLHAAHPHKTYILTRLAERQPTTTTTPPAHASSSTSPIDVNSNDQRQRDLERLLASDLAGGSGGYGGVGTSYNSKGGFGELVIKLEMRKRRGEGLI